MSRQALDELKQQIPLLGLSAGSSIGSRPDNSAGGRLMGLCPLHADHRPSFLVDPRKSLFYCYGCGRGGDVIRFAELYHQVKFPQALSLLQQWRGLAPLLDEAASFYRMQLHRHSEAVAYLDQRGVRSPELIEHMRIGYAPGGCLRGWLTQLGYSAPVATASRPSHCRRLRCLSRIASSSRWKAISMAAACRLRRRLIASCRAPRVVCMHGQQVRRYPEVILVEGLFDYAVLWQAGFHNVTCSLGNHLNAHQYRQLCDGPRTVYLAFDADTNGSGQQAAQSLACRLREHGVNVLAVALPEGHDPNSFFVQDGDARQFQSLLEAAQ